MVADAAIRFIGEKHTKPFFAHVSFYDVHTPLQAKPELLAKYDAGNEEGSLEQRFDQLWKRTSDDSRRDFLRRPVPGVLALQQEQDLDQLMRTCSNPGKCAVHNKDIARPHAPKEVAYFMPDVPPGSTRVQSSARWLRKTSRLASVVASRPLPVMPPTLRIVWRRVCRRLPVDVQDRLALRLPSGIGRRSRSFGLELAGEEGRHLAAGHDLRLLRERDIDRVGIGNG